MALGGCVAGAAAAAPILASGASAGEVGYAFWSSGTFEYADEATLEQMTEAVETTNARLSLDVIREYDTESASGSGSEPGSASSVYERAWILEARDRPIMDVRVYPISDTIVNVTVHVGALGNRPAARLYLDRLKQALETIKHPEASPVE